MKQIVALAFVALALPASALAQNSEAIDKALAAAPARARDATTVIKWKADGTYDTLKRGTNTLVCYDRSDLPGMQPFAVQCTSMGNLNRVAQNRKFEMIADRAERKKQLDAAEANGTRVKPEYGSVWLTMSGPDQSKAQVHRTIAVPGATAQSTGLPDKPNAGGAWIMDAGTSTAHLMIPGT
jgi:hypothetical protein